MNAKQGDLLRLLDQVNPGDEITVFHTNSSWGREAELRPPTGMITVALEALGFDESNRGLHTWPFLLIVNQYMSEQFGNEYLPTNLRIMLTYIEITPGERSPPPPEMLNPNAKTLPQGRAPRRLIYTIKEAT